MTKCIILVIALAAVASAQFAADSRYFTNTDGRYVHDTSGSYKSTDGQYHPDESGRYVHDDAGAYSGDYEKYKHQDEAYRHQGDVFGVNGRYTGVVGVRPVVTKVIRPVGVIPVQPTHALRGQAVYVQTQQVPQHVQHVVPQQVTVRSGVYDNNQIGIVRKSEQVDTDGYQYLYETENGILAEEQGKLASVGTDQEAMRAVGYYTYTGPDNVQYRVEYTADENGFQPTGAHLPTPPPIPQAILRSLEYQRSQGTL